MIDAKIFYDLLKKYSEEVDLKAIIIGAMDGVSFDNIHEFVKVYDWSCIFVEPVYKQFEKLKENFGLKENYQFVNKGISDKNETKKFVKIKDECLDNIPHGFAGMTSIYPPKNNLRYSDQDECKELVEFTCIDVQTLLKETNTNYINYLQIDTEGYDFVILKQFNLSNVDMIKIEHYSLDITEQSELKILLENNNFVYFQAIEDTYAIKERVLKDYE